MEVEQVKLKNKLKCCDNETTKFLRQVIPYLSLLSAQQSLRKDVKLAVWLEGGVYYENVPAPHFFLGRRFLDLLLVSKGKVDAEQAKLKNKLKCCDATKTKDSLAFFRCTNAISTPFGSLTSSMLPWSRKSDCGAGD